MCFWDVQCTYAVDIYTVVLCNLEILLISRRMCVCVCTYIIVQACIRSQFAHACSSECTHVMHAHIHLHRGARIRTGTCIHLYICAWICWKPGWASEYIIVFAYPCICTVLYVHVHWYIVYSIYLCPVHSPMNIHTRTCTNVCVWHVCVYVCAV